jgi:hypothetical protein
VIGHLDRLEKAIEQANEAAESTPLADKRFIDLTVYLAYCAKSIRQLGWVSGSEAYESRNDSHPKTSTRDSALNAMSYGTPELQPDPEDYAYAEEAMAWAAEQDESRNEYMHNIVMLAKTGYGDYKAAGFAASIVRIYGNHQAKQGASATGFIGEVGKKIAGEVTIVSNEEKAGTDWQGNPSTFRIVTMRARSGETIVSIGQFNPGNVGHRFTLHAKVKEHKTYGNKNQTIVNYCKAE